MISFWKRKYGGWATSAKGLDERDIEFLKSLKVGDKLQIFDNSTTKKSEKHPDLNLKIIQVKEQKQEKEEKEFLG